jgi:hypothetical protein
MAEMAPATTTPSLAGPGTDHDWHPVLNRSTVLQFWDIDQGRVVRLAAIGPIQVANLQNAKEPHRESRGLRLALKCTKCQQRAVILKELRREAGHGKEHEVFALFDVPQLGPVVGACPNP